MHFETQNLFGLFKASKSKVLRNLEIFYNINHKQTFNTISQLHIVSSSMVVGKLHQVQLQKPTK